MLTRRTRGLLAAAAIAVAPLGGHVGTDPPPPPGVPDAYLPLVKIHRYRMSGHIRPLLFWISRDDVGDGRLAWRKGEDGAAGWDFVIGTDPARAPRRLNRWGYIAEQAKTDRGDLFAMISSEEEDSLGEVNDNADKGTTGGGEFKAVLGRVAGGVAEARVRRVRTPDVMTIGDLDTLLALAQTELDRVDLKTVDLPPGVRPGFLAAVAEMVDASISTHRMGVADAGRRTAAVQYVFGDKLYDLTLTSARRLTEFRDSDRRYTNVVKAKFEIRTLATGAKTDFELVYGAEGDLAGVPVLIAFQPRWWLKVALHLDDDRDTVVAGRSHRP
ncbi:MAG TPA: hypothetical protein VMW52_08990 [Phycisphaerae bacterium]|nr:hypothetical protein [Phycisphaerae bacterium]